MKFALTHLTYDQQQEIVAFIAKLLSEEREALIKECQKLENQILIAGKNGREAERQRLRVAIGELKTRLSDADWDGYRKIDYEAGMNAVLKILGEEIKN